MLQFGVVVTVLYPVRICRITGSVVYSVTPENEITPLPNYYLPIIIFILSLESSAMMVEAVRTSETSVNFNVTTLRYIPEDSKLHTRRRKNPKSHHDYLFTSFVICPLQFMQRR
jgi:hypothetical protein